MTSANNYKILAQKCLSYFTILENELGRKIDVKKETNKERFGFYLYILECICNIKDTTEIANLITDSDFNSIVFNNKFNDYGVDAIYIDEENATINLFNFKYRETFVKGNQQSLNETILSTKFTNAILTNDIKK